MTVLRRWAMVSIVLSANSLRGKSVICIKIERRLDSLSDRFPNEFISCIVNARLRSKPWWLYSCPTSYLAVACCAPSKLRLIDLLADRIHTSSITSTLVRLRIARAMHKSCFSLTWPETTEASKAGEGTHPVEKFSPPSETRESRSRKTLTLTVSAASAGRSADGMRWTRRNASYYKLVHHFSIWEGSSEGLTISASLYSPNTSKVDLRVPLRTVGSSEEHIKTVSHSFRVGRRARGMIVRRLRRSVKPILLVSRLSISIRPSVGSTKRKNERARVLFPEPVRPRMPTYVI